VVFNVNVRTVFFLCAATKNNGEVTWPNVSLQKFPVRLPIYDGTVRRLLLFLRSTHGYTQVTRHTGREAGIQRHGWSSLYIPVA